MPQLDFPWEREIMQTLRENKHFPMPDGLSIFEQAAFQAISCLYSRYYRKEIDKDAASREKKLIKRTLEESRKSEALAKCLVDYHAEITRKTELYRREYRNASTQEEAVTVADELMQAIDNVTVSHKWKEEK